MRQALIDTVREFWRAFVRVLVYRDRVVLVVTRSGAVLWPIQRGVMRSRLQLFIQLWWALDGVPLRDRARRAFSAFR